MKKRFAMIFLLAMFPIFKPQAARFPNAITQEYIFNAKDLPQFLELLGLNTLPTKEISYPLHPMILHARTISIDPATQNNSDENHLKTTDSTEPQLVLSGTFLDQKTGTGDTPYTYAFYSPIIKEGSIPDNGWGFILKKWSGQFNPLQPRKNGKILFEKTAALPSGIKILLKIYQAVDYKNSLENWSYQVSLELIDKTR